MIRVLKHKHSGRLFLETPALLKNRHLEPASTQETAEFEMALGSVAATVKQEVSVDLSADIDADMDISFLGKGELVAIANHIKVTLPMRATVNEIKSRVAEGLAAIKAARAGA